jgi:hypothetical protein
VSRKHLILQQAETYQPFVLWKEPDLLEEAGEYFENPYTKKEFQTRGLSFNTYQELTDFMLRNGKMVFIAREELAKRPQNLTLSWEDFEKELKDVDYSKGYRRLEKALEIGALKIPAPIIFDFGDFYYGFAGNRRMNLAFSKGLELSVWMVTSG